MYWLDEDDADRKGREYFPLEFERLVIGYYIQPSRALAVQHKLDELDSIYPDVAHVIANTCHRFSLLHEYRYKQPTPFHLIEKPLIIALVLGVLTQHAVWQHSGRWISATAFESWFCNAINKPLHRSYGHGWTFALEYITCRAVSPRSMSTTQRAQCIAELVLTTPRAVHERCVLMINREFARATGRSTLFGHFRSCYEALCRAVFVQRRQRTACSGLYDEAAGLTLKLVQRVCNAMHNATLHQSVMEMLCGMTAQDIVGTCLFIALKERCEACFAREPITRRSLALSANLLAELHHNIHCYFHHMPSCNVTYITTMLDTVMAITLGHDTANDHVAPLSGRAELRRYSSHGVAHSTTSFASASCISYEEVRAEDTEKSLLLTSCDFTCLRDASVVACYAMYMTRNTPPLCIADQDVEESNGVRQLVEMHTNNVHYVTLSHDDDLDTVVNGYLVSNEERAKRRVVMETLYGS